VTGAIRYRDGHLAVLVVGRSPQIAAGRLGGDSVVTLSADAAAFLQVCTDALLTLLDQVAAFPSVDALIGALRSWTTQQEKAVAEWVGLTTDQRGALQRLAEDRQKTVFEDIRVLRGIRHPQVAPALQKLLGSGDPDIRSAAAGALGMAQSAESVIDLSDMARNDPVPAVRLEASLALCKIATPQALQELERRKGERPEDSFISELTQPPDS
jgi:hypothetical protein